MTDRFQYVLSSWLSMALLHQGWAQQGPALRGYVYDSVSRQPLAGVSVVWPQRTGTTTTANGYFTMTVASPEKIPVTFSRTGYTAQTILLSPRDSLLTVMLVAGNTLPEVVVKATITDQRASDSPQMSQLTISVGQLTRMPSLFGEADVLKVIQLLPGVQKGSEGNAGIYVRGGGPDQNLILLDGATVYNPTHLLGFFSAFNSGALSRVELLKGGFPARFGGRASSIITLETKTGNADSIRTEASVGILSSRVTIDGPLARGAIRFMIAARRTYVDLLTGLSGRLLGNGAGATQSYFYDLNHKIQWQVNARNRLTASGFFSRDQFTDFRQPAGPSLRSALGWTNRVAALRWDRVVSEKDQAHWGLFYSQYDLSIATDEWLPNGTNAPQRYGLRYQSGIRDITVHYSRGLFFDPAHELRTGAQTIYHRFTPDAVVVSGTDQEPKAERQYIDALESGLWVEDTWKPASRWRLNGGIRLSHYLLADEGRLGAGRGPKNTATDSALPTHPDTTNTANPTDQLFRRVRFEPRLSVAYRLQPNLSLKASYAVMHQYVHLLSSTGVGLPADLWIPSTDQLKPQQSQQVGIGLVRDAQQTGLTITLETYYKTMHNLISYAEGANFLSRTGGEGGQAWATNVTTGRGWSSGVEALVQKRPGGQWLPRLSGWVGYTLSWTRWQFAGLNGGKPFFPRYDRRHDASVVLLFDLSPAMTLSATWVYGTGNALTLPLSRFSGYTNRPQTGNQPTPSEALFGTGPNVKEYGERNGLRAEPYHRLDLSWQIRRQRRTYERTWAFGVYNAYNRRNPFYYSLEGKDQGPGLPSATVLYRYSIFSILPSVTYSIRF